MTFQAAIGEDDGQVRCWCCGARRPPGEVVRLGNHPEVALCFRCAHWAHHQARSSEDATRPTPAARVRDVLRAGRREVMRRGWHHKPILGPVLRWLGPRLP